MVFIVLATFFLMIGLCFAIFSYVMLKKDKNFKSNKKYGTAEIVGYRQDMDDYRSEPSLLVKILEENDGNLYTCKCGKINLSDYPKGKIVNIEYAPIKEFGINVMDVRMIENPQIEGYKLSKIFNFVAIIIFVISILLFVIGAICL